MRTELQDVLNAAKQLPPDELPRLLGELREIETTALARLTSPSPAPQQDSLLDVDHAAERLGVSTGYLYQNHKSLPFTRKMGKRLLFSTLGIEKFLKQQPR